MTGSRSALLIAASEYDDPELSSLRWPSADVESLAAVLGDPEIGGFEVHAPLVNRPWQEVREEIEAFLSSASKQDFRLLYFSCHGLLNAQRRLFFAMPNTKSDRLLSTGIDDVFVHMLMQGSQAATKVLILDCCHSGAFARGLAGKGDGERDIDVGRFEGGGVVTLTASREIEYAYEGDHLTPYEGAAGGSIFTRVLVEGLRTGEADTDGDGRVSVDELYQWVDRRVRMETDRQHPGSSAHLHGGVTIAWSRKRSRLPDAVRTALEAEHAVGRQWGIAQLGELARTADGPLADEIREALLERTRDEDVSVAAAAEAVLHGRPPPVAASAATAAPAPPSSRAESLMRQAEDHRRAGRIKLALARYEEALKLAPQATAARVGRARMLVGLHRTAEALDELDAAIADDPRNAWARIAHAEVLVSLERHAGALIDTEAALEEEPDSIEALTVHGRLLTALGRHEESLEAFDQALKLDRDHVDAHVGRAEALAAMGADARARAAADRALERDPRSTDALLVKAQLQYGADRLAAGDKEIEAVLDIDPRDVRARLTRGREHLRRGDDRRALADFDAALVVEPELPGALYGRAAVLRERDPAGALHALERAFAAQRVAGAWQPGAAEVRELQAGLLLDAGRVEEALVAIEHGLAEAPGSAALLAARAQAQLALGRPQLALLDIDEAGAAGADVASLRTEAVAALAAQPPETWPEGITDSDVAHARYGNTLFAATLPDVRFDPYELARRAGHEDELLCLTGCRHRQEMLRRVVLLLTSRRLIWAGRVEGEVEWRDVRDVRPLPPNGMRLVLHEGRRLEFPGISDAGVDLSGADRRLDASGVLELAASLAR